MNDIKWCIDYLKKYNKIDQEVNLPDDKALRALMNIVMPIGLSEEFYERQDKAIQEIIKEKKIVDVDELDEIEDRIILYKGDITSLKADAIVNACNEKLLGCFVPLHNCIDNAIHSFAGLQVRRDLLKVMTEQGHDEINGQVKVTKGYNLPSSYIFHTVGPKVYRKVSQENEDDLRSCYVNCLKKANELELKTLVFCSISTGIYGFPIEKACRIAINCVKEYLKTSNINKAIFNVFSEEDYEIYYRTIKEIYKRG